MTARIGSPGHGVRRILEADLWEISIVTFPMLPGARVGQVKTGPRALPSTRDFERWLTRDAGLSRRDARLVIAKGFAALRGRCDAGERMDRQLADVVRNAAQSLS